MIDNDMDFITQLQNQQREISLSNETITSRNETEAIMKIREVFKIVEHNNDRKLKLCNDINNL